tara:strand:+ start:4034 stop:4423 length:390 start_codon:yes stop_codon:yes gene_type:complete
MADDKQPIRKKKTDLVEKIGLFIDKALTFGGGLQYTNTQINNAVNAIDSETDYSIDSWRDIKTQSDFDKFKSILRSMKSDSDSGNEPPTSGKTGGMVIKSRKGNKISPRKPKVAGRLASRGYGKAFKGR